MKKWLAQRERTSTPPVFLQLHGRRFSMVNGYIIRFKYGWSSANLMMSQQSGVGSELVKENIFRSWPIWTRHRNLWWKSSDFLANLPVKVDVRAEKQVSNVVLCAKYAMGWIALILILCVTPTMIQSKFYDWLRFMLDFFLRIPVSNSVGWKEGK